MEIWASSCFLIYKGVFCRKEGTAAFYCLVFEVPHDNLLLWNSYPTFRAVPRLCDGWTLQPGMSFISLCYLLFRFQGRHLPKPFYKNKCSVFFSSVASSLVYTITVPHWPTVALSRPAPLIVCDFSSRQYCLIHFCLSLTEFLESRIFSRFHLVY